MIDSVYSLLRSNPILVFIIVGLIFQSIYTTLLFRKFRNLVYLDVLDFLIERNKKSYDPEQDLNTRLEELQRANFAPKMRKTSHIRLVPERVESEP